MAQVINITSRHPNSNYSNEFQSRRLHRWRAVRCPLNQQSVVVIDSSSTDSAAAATDPAACAEETASSSTISDVEEITIANSTAKAGSWICIDYRSLLQAGRPAIFWVVAKISDKKAHRHTLTIAEKLQKNVRNTANLSRLFDDVNLDDLEGTNSTCSGRSDPRATDSTQALRCGTAVVAWNRTLFLFCAPGLPTQRQQQHGQHGRAREHKPKA